MFVSNSSICGLSWIRRRTRPATPNTSHPLNLVDLFAGCGGLTLGVTEAGRHNGRRVSIRLAVDLSPFAHAVYSANFPNGKGRNRLCDVSTLFSGGLGDDPTSKERQIQSFAGRVDIIVAG